MSRFAPASLAEAIQNRAEKPPKPRKPISRGTKGLNRGSFARSSPQNGRNGNAPTPLKRSGIARGKAAGAKKKGKRLTTSQLKKKAWVQFSIFIRTRRADAEGMVKCCTCVLVKPWKEMQAGHFLRGRLNANLFDERGVNEQCYGCNVGRDGNVVEYYVWMLANHGQAVIDELRTKNNVTHKWEPGELRGLFEKYRDLNKLNPLLREGNGD